MANLARFRAGISNKPLIDKSDGKVTDFFYPFTKPNSSKIRKKIDRLLAGKK